MSSYAKNTNVSASKTKAEIEDLLSRHGCDEFGVMQGASRAMVGFRISNGDAGFLRVQITLHLPDRDDPKFKRSPAGRKRYTADQAYQAWEQACRSKWRSLFLGIKAKLVMVEDGISTIEREFLPDVVTDNGMTVERRISCDADTARMIFGGGSIPLLPGGEA